MAMLIFNNQLLLTPILLLIAFYSFRLGKAQTGIAGTGIGYIPQPGSGSVGDRFGGDGDGDDESRGIEGAVIAKALVCLNDKIYSECEESYRLTESGDLHIPPDYTDQYCGGPCVKETNLALNCISGLVNNFIFYNHATITNVKEAIKAGCSFGPSRGNFNVAEHIEADKSYKFSYPILFWLLPLISVCILLF
ncbi:hypothetical protein R6Q59_006561 [Mikania micrantha]